MSCPVHSKAHYGQMMMAAHPHLSLHDDCSCEFMDGVTRRIRNIRTDFDRRIRDAKHSLRRKLQNFLEDHDLVDDILEYAEDDEYLVSGHHVEEQAILDYIYEEMPEDIIEHAMNALKSIEKDNKNRVDVYDFVKKLKKT